MVFRSTRKPKASRVEGAVRVAGSLGSFVTDVIRDRFEARGGRPLPGTRSLEECWQSRTLCAKDRG